MVPVHLVFTSCFVGWGKWTVYFFDCLPPLTSCLWISSGSPCPEWRKQPKIRVISNNMDSDNKWASLIKVGSFYHVNIKLVQTAKWCLRDGPKGENKANSGEGAFASRQAAHVIQVSLVSLTWLHLEERICFINLSLLLPSFWAIKTQFGIVSCGGKIRLNMLREKHSTYWDREGFILVVKGHVSSEASLSQHAIKVVLTACREEPETG